MSPVLLLTPVDGLMILLAVPLAAGDELEAAEYRCGAIESWI